MPIQWYGTNQEGEKEIFWQNPRPSFVRYCRPIRMLFQKPVNILSARTPKDVDEDIGGNELLELIHDHVQEDRF